MKTSQSISVAINDVNDKNSSKIGIFEKYLSIWVLLCMASGVAVGYFLSPIPRFMEKLAIGVISMPIAILLWAMILPMMVQIDFASLRKVWLNPKGIVLTSAINYAVQPFAMYAMTTLFFGVVFRSWMTQEEVDQYIAGGVILGGSPCTAMVFVWSALTNGNPSYTLTQVAVNDLLILIFYSPTVKILLKLSNLEIPLTTVLIAVVIFVLIPLIFGALLRYFVVHHKGIDYLNMKILPKLKPMTIIALLLTLVLIFMFQAGGIVGNPVHIVLIAIPLSIFTYGVWIFAYSLAYLFRLPFDIAAPSAMIASSNFFELAVAVTISLYGADDPAVLVTTVGVLTEVPIMLSLVYFSNISKEILTRRAQRKTQTENVAPISMDSIKHQK